jgi:ribosomal protein L37AE/L43A
MSSTAKKVYYCECCGYNSKLKKDFNKHLVTKKHNINIENDRVDLVTDETEKSDDEQEETSLRDPRDQREQRVHHQDIPVSVKKRYECAGCNKVYKDYSGLWKHNRKSCIKPTNNGAKNTSASNTMVNTDLLNKIMEQNQELQKQVFELSKNSNTTNSHNTNSHNTTNKETLINE